MELVRKFGPYLAVELFVPGGTLVAVSLYLYRRYVDLASRRSTTR
jgi:hypothetical protein